MEKYSSRGNWLGITIAVAIVGSVVIGLCTNQNNELNISFGSPSYFFIIFFICTSVMAGIFVMKNARLWNYIFSPEQKLFSKILMLVFLSLSISFFILNTIAFLNSHVGLQKEQMIKGIMRGYIETSNRKTMVFYEEESGEIITLNLEGCSEENVKVGDKFEYQLKVGSLGFFYVSKGATGRSSCRKKDSIN